MKYDLIDKNKIDIEHLDLEKVSYTVDETVIHKGHIPRVGFIMLNENALASSGRKEQEIPKYSIVGLRELYHNQPLNFSLKMQEGAEAFSVDRSTLLNALESGDESQLGQLLSHLLIQSAV